MDYTRSSVSALFRGPIRSTPQGCALVMLSAIYLIGAALALSFSGIAPASLKLASFAGWCAFMPVLLFLFYVKNNQPDFAPSKSKAAWSVIVGLTPVPIWLWHVYA